MKKKGTRKGEGGGGGLKREVRGEGRRSEGVRKGVDEIKRQKAGNKTIDKGNIFNKHIIYYILLHIIYNIYIHYMLPAKVGLRH